MLVRLISGLVLLVVVLVTAYLGGVWWLLVVESAVYYAVGEFYDLASHIDARMVRPLGRMVTALLLISPQLPISNPLPPILAVSIVLLFFWELWAKPSDRSLVGWALTLAGALYVGFLGSYLIALRLLPEGFGWLITTIAIPWANDTIAYVVGVLIGRHPFSPTVSPKKTWEGTIGGLIAAIIAGSLSFTYLLHLSPATGALLGLLAGGAGIAGDLAESFLKRQANVKDTGSLIPGHGGMLDRLDSLLFAAVVVYYYAVWIGR